MTATTDPPESRARRIVAFSRHIALGRAVLIPGVPLAFVRANAPVCARFA